MQAEREEVKKNMKHAFHFDEGGKEHNDMQKHEDRKQEKNNDGNPWWQRSRKNEQRMCAKNAGKRTSKQT